MTNSKNIPSSNRGKIIGPEVIEEKRRLAEQKKADEKRKRAIDAIVEYSKKLDW